MTTDEAAKAIEAVRGQLDDLPNLPGYEITRLIGQGGSGKVYEAAAPGGFLKAVKVVRLDPHNPLTEREINGLRVVRQIRHPYLVSIDRLDIEPNRITLVMELAEGSLRDLFKKYENLGELGIPRDELLSLLVEAAEALDVLNIKYRLQHLDIKPENLFLIADHLKVGDYGLVRETGKSYIAPESNAVTPSYAAPELFDGTMSAASDQYSLAVVFVEMLTGQLPFKTNNVRQLALFHLTRPPDLSMLSEHDRRVVQKAMSRNPADRYACCLDFMEALHESGLRAHTTNTNPVPAVRRSGAVTVKVQQLRRPRTTCLVFKDDTKPTLEQLQQDQVVARSEIFATSQSVDQVREDLQFLSKQWSAEWLDFGPLLMAIRLESRSGKSGPIPKRNDHLLVTVHCHSRVGGGRVLMEVTTAHLGSTPNREDFSLHSQAILDAIRQVTESEFTDERLRGEVRFPTHCIVTITPIAGLLRHMPIRCTAMNYSRSGLGLVSATALDPCEVRVRLPGTPQLIRAKVVYSRPNPEHTQFWVGLQMIDGTVEPEYLQERTLM
jgi:serine/threonine protein kinase